MEYGDFLSVKSFIDENVLNTSNAISMKKIHALYGTGYENENAPSYRAKLKQNIINQYENSLLFLTIDAKTPQVIISAKCLDSATIVKDKKATLIECAKVLREDIINYAKNYEMQLSQLKILSKIVQDRLMTFLQVCLNQRFMICQIL